MSSTGPIHPVGCHLDHLHDAVMLGYCDAGSPNRRGNGCIIADWLTGETRLLPRDQTKPGQTRSDHIGRDSNALCGLKCGEDATWVLILSVDGLYCYQSRVTDPAD
jgi:hypothetical protein